MTQDEIIEIARQAGGTFGSHIAWVERDLLPVYVRFAHLIAEKEREACWRMAENYDTGYEAATAIRARGQA